MDADVGHGDLPAVFGSVAAHVSCLQRSKGDRLLGPECLFVHLPGICVETGRIVDSDDRRGGIHPGQHLIGKTASGAATKQRIDHDICLNHLVQRDHGDAG